MPRQLRTQRRHLHLANRFTSILAMLLSVGSAGIAAAAAPAFQGTFTSAGLCSPRGVGVSPSGDVFVGSDCENPFMVRFTMAGAQVGTLAFPGGYVGSPNGLAVDGSGNVYATDYEGRSLYKFTSSGVLLNIWSTSTRPVDVTVSSSGDVFVVELDGRKVEKFASGGQFLTTIGSAGSGPGQFQEPVGIALDASSRLYVSDAGRNRILRFLADGSFDMEFGVDFPPNGSLTDVAVGPDGNIYVINFAIGVVHQYSSSGAWELTFGSPIGLSGAFRIAINPTGAIFITEQYNNRVTKFQIDRTTAAVRSTFGRLKAMYR